MFHACTKKQKNETKSKISLRVAIIIGSTLGEIVGKNSSLNGFPLAIWHGK